MWLAAMTSLAGLLSLAASVLFLFVAQTNSNHNISLSRKRRYLNFPDKANIVITCTLLKGIANDVTWFPTTKVLTIHEMDILFPLPHDPSPFELGQTALGQPPVFKQPAAAGRAARHRRQLYAQLEDAFYMQGLEGRSCILRAICEAKLLRHTAEENLLNELLSLIFTLPRLGASDVGGEYSVVPQRCPNYIKSCPVSLFDLAKDWAHLFSNQYLSVTKNEHLLDRL